MNHSDTIAEKKMGNELIPFTNDHTIEARGVFTPHVDIIEDEDALTLYADLPGVQTEDLDIRVHHGELAIAGSVRHPPEPAKFLAKEYELGSFYRSFQMTDDIDTSRITAELKNGELRVHLPKLEIAKPIRIKVQAG